MIRVIPDGPNPDLVIETHKQTASCPVVCAIGNELNTKPRKENRGKKQNRLIKPLALQARLTSIADRAPGSALF